MTTSTEETPGPSLQHQLVNLRNPFAERFGLEFFKRVPNTPGVYWMMDSRRQLLYVGKSKNLRLRLASYKYLNPLRSPRKLSRLIQQVHYIQWTQCDSESSALLIENQLLRRYQPPFNVVNTRPDTYLFLGFIWTPSTIQFAVSSDLDRMTSVNAYGAFRSRVLTQQAYTALLRLIWQILHKSPQFSYPTPLTRPVAPANFRLFVPRWMSTGQQKDWNEAIDAFLLGKCDGLLSRLNILEEFAQEQDVPPFIRTWLKQDLELLQRFYDYGPARNEQIRELFSLSEPLISQQLLDDLLVLYKSQLKK